MNLQKIRDDLYDYVTRESEAIRETKTDVSTLLGRLKDMTEVIPEIKGVVNKTETHDLEGHMFTNYGVTFYIESEKLSVDMNPVLTRNVLEHLFAYLSDNDFN